MTQKVPKARCRRCRHYNEFYGCHLEDLEPCPKHRELKPWQILLRLIAFELVIIGVAILVCLLFTGCSKPIEEEEYHWSAVELLRNQHKEELTEWQLLQMAIIFTESKGDPTAVGSAGDSGIYQMLDCYVEEVNRVSGSGYRHEDAFDIDNAIDMFNLLQGHYNPERNRDKAIRYHNRSDAYKATVLRNMEMIRRMEVCRKKLIEHEQ